MVFMMEQPLFSRFRAKQQVGSDGEDSWALFDFAERGLCREEAGAELAAPCTECERLQRFQVKRLSDSRGWELRTASGDRLMSAAKNSQTLKVEFFLYDPSEKSFDESCPAFSMSCSGDRSTWLLVQEEGRSRPSTPSTAPSTPTTATEGSQRKPKELALIRHFSEDVGDGRAKCMEVSLPSFKDTPRRSPEQLDLAAGKGVGSTLVTRLPEWDETLQSLVLDFDGRDLMGSAKNFQLADESSPNEAVLQYGKIGGNTFCLDFKAPLSIVQAFGAALTAASWK
jgi:hypothetical protein